jgi:hypothetical protein
MEKSTTIYDFHGRLLRDTFGKKIDDRDAFLLFTLFHLCQVELTGQVLSDRPGLGPGDKIEPITQRSCSEALASLWTGDDARSDYCYWYYRWNGDWGSYGHAENLTREEVQRLLHLKEQLERHPFVKRFIAEEGFNLFESAQEQGSE